MKFGLFFAFYVFAVMPAFVWLATTLVDSIRGGRK